MKDLKDSETRLENDDTFIVESRSWKVEVSEKRKGLLVIDIAD